MMDIVVLVFCICCHFRLSGQLLEPACIKKSLSCRPDLIYCYRSPVFFSVFEQNTTQHNIYDV